MKHWVLFATVLTAIAVACIRPLPSAAQSGDAAPLDTEFLIKAVGAGNAEISFSELADSHSSNLDVKAFAKELIKDHEALNVELKQYASDQKIAILTGLEKGTRDEVEVLSRLKNDAFDFAYVNRMVDDHQKAVKLFENQDKNGKNAKLKAYAETALPTLCEPSLRKCNPAIVTHSRR